MATVLAIQADTARSAFVLLAVDLSFWRSAEEEKQIRTAILQRAGLAESQLILHQSHTHSAPPTSLQLASKPGGSFIQPYRQEVIDRCADAIQQALSTAEPAVLSWASGTCRLAYDRNFQPDPRDEPMVGLNPAVRVDDTVLAGRIVATSSRRILATLLNYACHPVSLGGANRLISPDYVGAARECVESATGGAPCMFLQGASGDLTPRRSYECDPGIADQNGRELGYAALAALQSLMAPGERLQFAAREESGASLALWRAWAVEDSGTRLLRRESVNVRLRIADLPSREELIASIEAAADAYSIERLERRLLLRQTVGNARDFDFRFEITQLGRSFLVSTPAEPHSPFQVELRRRFPEAAIAVLNIANGYLSYLPPASDFARGTYQARVALFQDGSLERVLEAASQRIAAMMAASHPIPSTAPNWKYS